MEAGPVKEATVVVKGRVDESLEDGEDVAWWRAKARTKRYSEGKQNVIWSSGNQVDISYTSP